MGGHFGRRRQILKATLERHRVPAHVIEAWLAHQDGLREQVTSDDITECNDVRAGQAARERDEDTEGKR